MNDEYIRPQNIEETKESLKRLFDSADLVLRPLALLINTKDKNLIVEAMPDIEEKAKIYESEEVTPGSMYIINRNKLEENFGFHPEGIYVREKLRVNKS